MVRKPVTNSVYLGIGSNIGDRLDNISRAIAMLKGHMEVPGASGIYETEPVGKIGQGMFLNCVVEARTDIPPIELLELLKFLEKKLGRGEELRWGPRVIDLDILAYGNEIVKRTNLIIPHQEMHRRRFVLIPLQEIAPGFVHPVLKRDIPSILKDVPEAHVKSLATPVDVKE